MMIHFHLLKYCERISSSTGLTYTKGTICFSRQIYYNFYFQAEARRLKVKEARKRREERQALKKEEMLKAYEAEDAPAEKTSAKK